MHLIKVLADVERDPSRLGELLAEDREKAVVRWITAEALPCPSMIKAAWAASNIA